jgi:hypothetical protein
MSKDFNELKNIKYQNIFSDNKNISSLERIDKVLNKEKNKNNISISWNKLNKLQKIEKLNDYVDNVLNKKNKIDKLHLKKYLKNCLDKKYLLKMKDVTYDKDKQCIVNIPNLIFKQNKYTLKVNDKKTSTLKNLGCGKTKKNKLLNKIDNKKE